LGQSVKKSLKIHGPQFDDKGEHSVAQDLDTRLILAILRGNEEDKEHSISCDLQQWYDDRKRQSDFDEMIRAVELVSMDER
jgi:hypothetical protein